MTIYRAFNIQKEDAVTGYDLLYKGDKYHMYKDHGWYRIKKKGEDDSYIYSKYASSIPIAIEDLLYTEKDELYCLLEDKVQQLQEDPNVNDQKVDILEKTLKAHGLSSKGRLFLALKSARAAISRKSINESLREERLAMQKPFHYAEVALTISGWNIATAEGYIVDQAGASTSSQYIIAKTLEEVEEYNKFLDEHNAPDFAHLSYKYTSEVENKYYFLNKPQPEFKNRKASLNLQRKAISLAGKDIAINAMKKEILAPIKIELARLRDLLNAAEEKPEIKKDIFEEM